MNTKHHTGLLLFLLAALATSCTPGGGKTEQTVSDAESDPAFLMEYAGGYSVEIEGIPPSSAAEVFVLKGDGSGKWMLMVSDGAGGQRIENEYPVNWRAISEKISITIESGSLEKVEEYEYRYDGFVNTRSSKRYLKPLH